MDDQENQFAPKHIFIATATIVVAFFVLSLIWRISRATLQPVTGGGAFYFPRPVQTTNANPAVSGVAMNQTSTDAEIIIAPKAGDICKVGFSTGSITTGANMMVWLGQVSSSTGDPLGSSTLLAANAIVEATLPAANTFKEVTLNAPATVTANQVFAVGFSATSTAAANTSFNLGAHVTGLINIFPYGDNMNTGNATWAHASTQLNISLGYCDGTYAVQDGYWPFSPGTAGIAFNASSAYSEIGNKITLPFPAITNGYWMWATSNPVATTTTSTAFLYDGSSNVVASNTFSLIQMVNGANPGLIYGHWNATTSLSANTAYRLTIKQITKANILLTATNVSGTAMMNVFDGGSDIFLTESTSSGANGWNDSSTYRAFIGLGFMGFGDGLGGTPRQTTGTLDSAAFDTGVASGAQYNSILWQGSQPAGTSVQFQLAVSNSSSGPWSYTGSDGTGNTYYTPSAPGSSVSLNTNIYNNFRYFRYRVYLSSDSNGTVTPRVDDVIINWSP